MNPGIYRNVPDADYRAWPAISQTSLKIIGEQSPAAFRWQKDHPREQSESMALGSAVDALVLETEAFGARFVVAPKVDRRTTAGKAEWASFQKAAAGKIVLDEETAARARAIADAVVSHPTAGPLVAGTEHQVSLFWLDAETGVACKGRLDLALPGHYLADLKTCRAGAALPDRWARYAHGLGYHYQAAFYHDGWKALTGESLPWLWCAVETEAPHLVAVYQAEDSWIWAGRDAYRRALAVYAHCVELDAWPGYDPKVTIIEPPAWALRNARDSGPEE